MISASLFYDLSNLEALVRSPVFWVLTAFQLWMLIDALQRQEWIWAVCIFFFTVISAVIYFMLVWWPQRGTSGIGFRGLELPGAKLRRRIKELQGQIHHLDKAYHHSQLGDVYQQLGNHSKAEASYRAALERDPEDLDTLSHFGECLLRQNKPSEALPPLERVIAQDPRHDYGYSLMALAEAYGQLGQTDAAIAAWRQVLRNNSYARARVQFAALLLDRGEKKEARQQLEDVLSDDAHAPAFQKGKDRIWIRRARSLLARA